jgi:hypothetical protein
MFRFKKLFYLLIFFSAGITAMYGQSRWSVNSSLQYASGNYLSDQQLHSWYLYGGIRYQANDFYAALSIPFIASNGQNVSQFGNIYIPNHMGSGSSGMTGTGGRPGGHMMGGGNLVTSSSTENYGLGDLYFYAGYNILNSFTSPVGLSADGYIKFPTASTSNGFGTGKFDFSLSGTLRKNFGSYLVYASGGFIYLGNPDSVTYNNPVTFNAGIGKFFGNGDLSVLLSYSMYSKILDIYQRPQQVSLGLNIMSNDKMTYTFIGSAGLSNSSPDFVLSAGIKYNLAD